MDRRLHLRRVSAACLAVLLAWNAAVVAQGNKTADEIADDHACTYFRALDPNRDKVATVLDYVFEWLTVPFCGTQLNLIIDLKRQVDIMQQYIYVFPLTDTNVLVSLLRGGVKIDEFLETMRRKRGTDLLKTQLGELIRFLMKVFNYDGDEQSFTQNELQILWNVVRLDDAPTAFARLDADGNGTVSYDEYYRAGEGYFDGLEDGRCEWFAGPPKTCVDVRAETSKWIDPVALGTAALSVPVGGSIGDVTVLANLLSKDPVVQAQLKTVFTEVFGAVPEALSSLLGVVSTALGTLGSALGPLGK